MRRNYKAEYARRKDLRAGEKHMIVYKWMDGKWTELYGHDCRSLSEMNHYVKKVGCGLTLLSGAHLKVVPRE